jgi:hypothetical protein
MSIREVKMMRSQEVEREVSQTWIDEKSWHYVAAFNARGRGRPRSWHGIGPDQLEILARLFHEDVGGGDDAPYSRQIAMRDALEAARSGHMMDGGLRLILEEAAAQASPEAADAIRSLLTAAGSDSLTPLDTRDRVPADPTRRRIHHACAGRWSTDEFKVHLAKIVDARARDGTCGALAVALDLLIGEFGTFLLFGRLGHLDPSGPDERIPWAVVSSAGAQDPDVDARLRSAVRDWLEAGAPPEAGHVDADAVRPAPMTKPPARMWIWRAFTAERARIADCGCAFAVTAREAEAIGWSCLGGPHLLDVVEIQIEEVRR